MFGGDKCVEHLAMRNPVQGKFVNIAKGIVRSAELLNRQLHTLRLRLSFEVMYGKIEVYGIWTWVQEEILRKKKKDANIGRC